MLELVLPWLIINFGWFVLGCITLLTTLVIIVLLSKANKYLKNIFIRSLKNNEIKE